MLLKIYKKPLLSLGMGGEELKTETITHTKSERKINKNFC